MTEIMPDVAPDQETRITCPNCGHHFRDIPWDVQEALAAALKAKEKAERRLLLEIIAELDARGSASLLINPHEAQVTHRQPITIRQYLQSKLELKCAAIDEAMKP